MNDETVALAALEQEWQRLGVPLWQVLARGSSESEVRELLRNRMGRERDDLVSWFTWQGGSLDSGWEAAPLGLQLLSIRDALAGRDDQIEVAIAYPTAGRAWEPRWLPLTDDPTTALYAVDTESGQVLFIDWWAVPFARVVAPSILAAIRYWVDILRQDYYRWVDGRWECDFRALPFAIRSSGLVN